MARVEINAQAPDLVLEDFRGQTVRLSDYRGQKHVVLVFNRGFM
ncbi:MAG: redoxin domain-containing protein [Anaerolineae bacterium]